MFCPKCKSEYREGIKTCADCGVDLVETRPAEPSVEYGNFVNILTCSSREEAELAKGLLVANGIEAIVEGDDGGGVQPALSFSTGVQVLAKSEDKENAKTILLDAGYTI